jgi:hypothetical protein
MARHIHPNTVIVRLSLEQMGPSANAEDYKRWSAFVAERLPLLVAPLCLDDGVYVDASDASRLCNSVDNTSDEGVRETIHELLGDLWTDWCGGEA